MAKSKSKAVKISVSMPGDLVDEVEKLAAQDSRSVSSFIAMAVRKETQGKLTIAAGVEETAEASAA